ncbi:MAG: hypothetical protein AAFX40_17465, partial [Cyanobacteria bacterium J06639_1]
VRLVFKLSAVEALVLGLVGVLAALILLWPDCIPSQATWAIAIARRLPWVERADDLVCADFDSSLLQNSAS